MSIHPEKAELRARMKSDLRALGGDVAAAASATLCARLEALPQLLAARTVLIYLPLPSEIDVLPFAAHLLRAGRVVAVPQVGAWPRSGEAGGHRETGGGATGSMHAVAVDSLAADALVVGPLGVRAPRGGRPLAVERIDAIVVPGLAFDHAGHRLGRGGGYYDRFLASRADRTVAIGVCFDQQLVPVVPVESHDASVDVVLTDRRLVYTRRAGAPTSTTEG